MTNATENKISTSSKIGENLDRITELLQILIRQNFRGWSYKFLEAEGRSPIFMVYKKLYKEDEKLFFLDFEQINPAPESDVRFMSTKMRWTALEYAMSRGVQCDLSARQIKELANFVEKVIWLIAD